MPPIPFDFIAAELLQAFAQLDDGRCNLARLKLQAKGLHFLIDDLLGPHCFLEPFFEVRINNLLQIIDVVHERIVDLIHCRIDISGHGDIDEKYRLVLPPMNDLLRQILSDDEVRCACRGNDDVGADHMIGEVLERDSRTLEDLCQLHRAFECPVRDQNRRNTRALQMLGGKFAHLAGADDHHGFSGEIAENLSCQFDRCVTDRHRGL